MGRDKHEKERRRERLPPFVPLLIDTLDAPAWKAMSHGARSLYVALKRHYNIKFHNNGKVFLSQRKAAQDLGSHHNEIARWFRELRHYGFIVMTAPGVLGVEGKGKAPRWRLTELGCMREYPTRDFLRWDGGRFKDTGKKSRTGIGARSVLENPHTSVPGNRPVNSNSVPEMGRISASSNVRENQHRTSLPYACAQRLPHTTPIVCVADAGLQPAPKRVRPRLNKTISADPVIPKTEDQEYAADDHRVIDQGLAQRSTVRCQEAATSSKGTPASAPAPRHLDVGSTTMDSGRITKLPPGEAIGARDLQNWAGRRLAGRSGVFHDNTPVRVFHCRSCGFDQTRTLSATERARCAKCGSKKISWRKVKP